MDLLRFYLYTYTINKFCNNITYVLLCCRSKRRMTDEAELQRRQGFRICLWGCEPKRGRQMRLPGRTLLAMVFGALLLSRPLCAEVAEVRISEQFGLAYLPLIVAKDQGLVEKHAKAAGLPDLKVSYFQFSGGAAVNDALLSGGVDFGSAGIGPLLTIWDKTKGNLDVRGIAAIDRNAIMLNTNNPSIKTIADFTDKDRIAVPSVKVSIQSVLLEIAAEQAFGMGNYAKLDPLTVSLKHPDAHAALLSGGAGLTAHFSQSPYGLQQLSSPKIHTVLTSNEILGGPATLNVIYTTARFHDANPKVTAAVLAALREADDYIATHKAAAAKLFVDVEKPAGVTPDLVEGILSDANLSGFQVTPAGVDPIADFLARTGGLSNKPASWKDYFFPEVYSGTEH